MIYPSDTTRQPLSPPGLSFVSAPQGRDGGCWPPPGAVRGLSVAIPRVVDLSPAKVAA